MTGKKVDKSPSRVYVNVSFKGLPEIREKRRPRLKEMSVEYRRTLMWWKRRVVRSYAHSARKLALNESSK